MKKIIVMLAILAMSSVAYAGKIAASRIKWLFNCKSQKYIMLHLFVYDNDANILSREDHIGPNFIIPGSVPDVLRNGICGLRQDHHLMFQKGVSYETLVYVP